jgi:hypothetical protein
MAEPTTPPGGPLAGASGRELRELQQFLLYLGSALIALGVLCGYPLYRSLARSLGWL